MRALRSFAAVAALLSVVGLTRTAAADGCYICSRGSADSCRDYCRYSGSDTFANRHLCQRRGCRIGGTASCPTAVNYHICIAPTATQRAPLAVCDRAHPNG